MFINLYFYQLIHSCWEKWGDFFLKRSGQLSNCSSSLIQHYQVCTLFKNILWYPFQFHIKLVLKKHRTHNIDLKKLWILELEVLIYLFTFFKWPIRIKCSFDLYIKNRRRSLLFIMMKYFLSSSFELKYIIMCVDKIVNRKEEECIINYFFQSRNAVTIDYYAKWKADLFSAHKNKMQKRL